MQVSLDKLKQIIKGPLLQQASMPIDYSKWNSIEISDDEGDTNSGSEAPSSMPLDQAPIRTKEDATANGTTTQVAWNKSVR